MNRKQRRIAQSQEKTKGGIHFRSKSYTLQEASALSVKEHGLRNFRDALELYDLILAQIPGYAEVYNVRGIALQEMGRHIEALASFDKAIALKPDYANAYSNRGYVLQLLIRNADALASYDKSIALKPDHIDAYFGRGNVLQKMKQYNEALSSHDKAIALKPDYANAYNSRGFILHELKRYDGALASYDKAIACNPNYSAAYSNRGITLQELKRHEEALASFDKAIALDPDCVGAYVNRGFILQELHRHEEALASFNKATALDPNIPYINGVSLLACLHHCRWEGLDHKLEKLTKDIEAGKMISTPLAAVVAGLSVAQQKHCAEIYIQNKYPPHPVPLWNGEHYSHDKIRIGYFSADFQNHATSFLMADLFELHDGSIFEVTGFSYGPPSADAMRKRLEKAFDHFIDVSAKSDLEIAQLARNVEIDIAIDLKGFTRNARTGVFAHRVAPVQVNYLGYPGTIGANYIDYLIADPILISEEHRCYYTEKIVYLPDSYQVNSRRIISDRRYTRQEVGLPENKFVFCCFSNNYKITPDLFDIWMRLLHKVPDSVLWLLGDNQAATKTLREEAKARGIAEHRLVFAPRMDQADHMARHGLADLFLDTLYCNAHTTASDALWTGLPVLTCLGETFAGRVAASLLHAIDLPELITHSHAEYEALALEFATHPDKLSGIRHKLAQNRTTRPLFDTTRFTKHIENSYRKMWEKNQMGMVPDHIYVDPIT
jgi:protein O-GlcNAc transferase